MKYLVAVFDYANSTPHVVTVDTFETDSVKIKVLAGEQILPGKEPDFYIHNHSIYVSEPKPFLNAEIRDAIQGVMDALESVNDSHLHSIAYFRMHDLQIAQNKLSSLLGCYV